MRWDIASNRDAITAHCEGFVPASPKNGQIALLCDPSAQLIEL